jgi:hypothetical protein
VGGSWRPFLSLLAANLRDGLISKSHRFVFGEVGSLSHAPHLVKKRLPFFSQSSSTLTGTMAAIRCPFFSTTTEVPL